MFEDKKYFDAAAASARMGKMLDRFGDLADPLRVRRTKLVAALELQQFMLAVQAQVCPRERESETRGRESVCVRVCVCALERELWREI